MADLHQRYCAYLAQGGFRPFIDDSQDICFKYEGRAYSLRVRADDPAFFQLWLPDLRAGDGAAVKAANSVTATVKGVKIIHDGNGENVQAVMESILPSSDGLTDLDQFERVLMRGLGALQYARRRFVDELAAAR